MDEKRETTVPHEEEEREVVGWYVPRQGREVVEYYVHREPLPEDITSITALPLGRADYIAAFEQRAREAFMVETAAVPATGIMPQRNIGALQWRYMDETFWGTVSPYDRMDWR